MPTQTVPDHATPAANSGADAETASNLAALMGFKNLASETSAGVEDSANEQNSQPEAGPVESVLSKLETASDGATEEVEGSQPKAERPEAETDNEAEASAEETAQTKPDAADPEGEDALEEWLATLPKGAARKLRAQHRQIADLKRELADAKAKQPEAKVETQVGESAPVVIDNRLEQITDLRELEKVEAKSRETLRSAERALETVDDLRDQLDVDPEVVVQQLKAAKYEPPEDREGLAKFLGEIKRNIRAERAKATDSLDAVPRRRAHLQQESQVLEQSAADYPWLKTKEGDDYQLFEQVIKARPQVRQMGPDWPFAAAVFVEGLKSLNARRSAKAKAAPVAAKAAALPPKQPSRSAPPRPAAGSAARSRFEQTAKMEDLAALMPA